MDLYNNRKAILDFKNHHRLRYGFNAFISVFDENGDIYDGKAYVAIGDDCKVSIEAKGISDDTWKRLGLHGIYSADYYDFVFLDDTLTIYDGEITIEIKKD